MKGLTENQCKKKGSYEREWGRKKRGERYFPMDISFPLNICAHEFTKHKLVKAMQQLA